MKENTVWGPELRKLVNLQKILESGDEALKVAFPLSFESGEEIDAASVIPIADSSRIDPRSLDERPQSLSILPQP